MSEKGGKSHEETFRRSAEACTRSLKKLQYQKQMKRNNKLFWSNLRMKTKCHSRIEIRYGEFQEKKRKLRAYSRKFVSCLLHPPISFHFVALSLSCFCNNQNRHLPGVYEILFTTSFVSLKFHDRKEKETTVKVWSNGESNCERHGRRKIGRLPLSA